MSEPPRAIDDRLRVLDEAIRDLSDRVHQLEIAAPVPDTRRTEPMTAPHAWVVPAAPATDITGTLSLVGRTVVVLGGAYLLRALAESGRVSEAGGVALGLAYASFWNIAADRAARTTRSLSGLFHGLAATLIGLPIIIEASVRFHSLSAEAAAAALAATTGLGLAVSAHRRLPSLAIVASASSVVAAIGLAFATGHVVPFACAIGVVAVGALWMGDALSWPWLRWAPALAADGLLTLALLRVLASPPAEPPGPVLILLLSFGITYGTSFAARLGIRRSRAGAFEFAQTVAIVLLGLLASGVVGRTQTRALVASLGALGVLAGLATYGLARAVARRPGAPRVNVHFTGMVALALALAGAATLATGAALGLWCAAAALIAMTISARLHEPIALMHGAVFTLSAAIASGLLTLVAAIWTTTLTAWPALPAAATIVLAAAVVSLAVPAVEPGQTSPTDAIARVMLGAVVALGVGAGVLLVAGPWIAGTPPDAGILASFKTAVLAGAAILLARLSRPGRAQGLGRLAYPALALGAIKLFAEDFRYSRPATLFIALALYGVALIAVPRMLKGSRGSSAG